MNTLVCLWNVFFSYLKEQNLFCMLKREQSSMYWAIEKSKQTSTNNSWTNSSEYGNINNHIIRTFCHICFSIWAQCFTHGFQTLITHGSCYMFCLLLSISDVGQWLSQSHWNTSSIFILHLSLHHLFSFSACRPLGASYLFHTKTWLLMQNAQRGYEIYACNYMVSV